MFRKILVINTCWIGKCWVTSSTPTLVGDSDTVTFKSAIIDSYLQGHITGIFFWGGKVIFPDFFPAWNVFFFFFFFFFEKIPILVHPKQISVVLNFFPSNFNFPPSLFLFSFFVGSTLTIFLASLFPIRQQKFPGQKSIWGGHSTPRSGGGGGKGTQLSFWYRFAARRAANKERVGTKNRGLKNWFFWKNRA